MSFCQETFAIINQFRENILHTLCTGKNSTVYREAKGQKITGAARAVITNNTSVDEDEVEIGYMLLPSLYPALYKKYTDENGTNLDAINEEIQNKLLLLNRQPTIGEKSMLALKPVFSADESTRYVIQINPIIVDSLAGDMDGDVVNLIALYSRDAIEEAKDLKPSRNYIDCRSSKLRICIFEDLEYISRKEEKQ